MREHVVRYDEAAWLEEWPRQGEQELVVVLLRVEEDDVERVLGRGKSLARVAAMFPRHASHFTGSCSSETSRPPSTRAPAASQIDE